MSAVTSRASMPRVAARGWNPRIVVFACNWCSYAGADTAGVSRIQHQPHFRMIRVMCSGRIQPGFVLRAFEKGADGVLVSGCHFGDCHYVFGNERAVEQFEKTMNVVKLLGLEQDRLRLEWISAAEGARFAQVINEFTEQVRELGPSPLGGEGPGAGQEGQGSGHGAQGAGHGAQGAGHGAQGAGEAKRGAEGGAKGKATGRKGGAVVAQRKGRNGGRGDG